MRRSHFYVFNAIAFTLLSSATILSGCGIVSAEKEADSSAPVLTDKEREYLKMLKNGRYDEVLGETKELERDDKLKDYFSCCNNTLYKKRN